MHYFSNLFDKLIYMFRTDLLSIIRSISTLLNTIRILTTLADSQQNLNDKNLLRVCSVEIFLMMDSGSIRNI